MESMSPQQENIGQSRSASLTGETKICAVPESKKKMKTLTQRRQSAPSLVISKALTKSRTLSRENCLSPVSPEACPLVQSFLTPSRTFVTYGYAQLKTGLQTQERHLFLFNDILLIAKAKSPTHFKLKVQVRVSEMWTATCMEEVCEGSTSPERSFVMGWPTFNCVATFSSIEQKEKWFSFIKSQIQEEKEKEDPKTIPLKIFAKDVGNSAYAKILTVSHTDCATEVIAMALQQFGISGCVKDYQLWVSSRKDDHPYPLIGHEFPFSIKMSHIRALTSQTGGGKDTITPPEPQEALLLEHMPSDTKCQFILKPCRVAVGQAIMESGQKPFRRKRSIINWAFWRGSSSQLDCLPVSPTSPGPGRLFGLPLSAVFEGDALPRPVMDMLVVLFQEGPFTRGIFRRSASAKACREMREKLNSGLDDITLTWESTFVTAAVFKDFLRHIPGSLLSQDLYEQWVRVLDQAGEGEEDRVQAVQRLVQRLPRENQLLLGHLLAVLHCIHRHADHNQMNSFNLSVCIAPSMLWPPASCSPTSESEGTRKVSEVVRFMIERCCEVLGEDMASLFGRFPQRGGGSDHGSDVSSFQLNDSSYDSLENELNDDTESSFQDLRGQKDKQESRSRDSVITLSDCDLDQADPGPDPAPVHLELPPLARPRKFTPAGRQSRARAFRDAPEREPICARGSRRLRRCSEPSLGHPLSSLAAGLGERGGMARKASYDAVSDREEYEVFGERLRDLQLDGPPEDGAEGRDGADSRGAPRRKHKQAPPPLRLDASCSSLSSPATSPSGSSLSSLDSAFSQGSTDYTLAPPAEPCRKGLRAQGNTPASPSSPCTTPSREAYDWSQNRSAHGLHPNSWLKRGRRLSLRQQDGEGGEEEVGQREPSGSPGASQDAESKAHGQGELSGKRPSSPPTYQQAMLKIQRFRSPCCRAKEKGLAVKELRGAVFYGQNTSCVTLQREEPQTLPPASEGSPKRPSALRRASEPTGLGCHTGRASTLERLYAQALADGGKTPAGLNPQDSGLKVTDVEPHNSPELRFCLSPSATRAVKDYFSSHVDTEASLRRSQEVAAAIVQSKREWQSRRCSDPRFDDFEQIFFAEESYV
ncbi:hypothetical protein MATL_G00178490 [Megalops atlanticus]|uniref:Rho GTPase-activating protein 20 n=1 Tax=Megalops atlanticus TaxID=7932 RepID=A0A9D3PLS6_MEGAT|nr:hypothetical protein MATL_G00178490 [Megalops atlanticus]